jgi:hypothetical protein
LEIAVFAKTEMIFPADYADPRRSKFGYLRDQREMKQPGSQMLISIKL